MRHRRSKPRCPRRFFTGPRRQASCCRNFPSIRACTVAPSQIISKRAHPRFPRIEAKSIHRNTQHRKASVQQPHTQSSRRRTTVFSIPPSLNLVRVSRMLDGFRLRVQQRSSPCRRRELAATERGAYATDATADFGSVCRSGHPKHRPKQRRHGELAHKSGKAPNHEPQGLTGEGRRVSRVGSALDNPADGVVGLKPAALMNQSCPVFLTQTGAPSVITTSPAV